MPKKLLFEFFVIFFLLLLIPLPRSVFAATISVTDLSSTIDYDQAAEVEINFICDRCGDSYFRGVFYPSGKKYFGYTMNNSGSWVGSASDKTNYFRVASDELVESSWSGKLKVKPDPEDSSYIGPGIYSFKVGRYTSANSSATWSNVLTVTINGPTPTSSPSPTPTPTPSLSPSPSPSPSPSIKPSPSPSPKLSPSPRVLSASNENNEDLIIGLRDQLTATESQSLVGAEVKEKSFSFGALFFMLGGVTFISVAGFSFIRGRKERYTSKSDGKSEENY